jgi:hypothetical protein
MTRVGFFKLLAAFGFGQSVPIPAHPYKLPDDSSTPCPHNWTKGPFYITAAQTYEEPGYYPPSVLLRVEHCSLCGILRLPKDTWELNGDNMDEGHIQGKR